MARQMGAALTEKGNIKVNEKMESTIPGLLQQVTVPAVFCRWQRQFTMVPRQDSVQTSM